ncbi:unnamed protein product [Rotaria magnacalcarata]|uniref:MULE transposase domain-containing protein n=1 Tax=Rotaria magnacalcarata TaxID=392030 RepID=A0A815RIG3_9BILA|nr:unnamed protein product [Rotaria magnacalcarata]CAF1618007.1 unnamed protein product [Rotaria magnacalcarata]CAF2121685.1 unnamed protein product [Rotaria magnacalcarata]CAF4165088.1 unnamed protein product [Rotaria magnacalcarata]CAF4325029.1 unnamed protein product [Rotaria magnacalcarata]
MVTNAIIPLVYGLLIGKSNDDYNQFFEKLFEQDNFQPESIMTDFESVEVTTAFGLIANQFDDDADDLLDYFEQIWIGEPRRRGTGRKKCLFDHKLWNIHDRVIAALPLSNNSVEGWHNAFDNRVSISHPDIMKLTEKIRREQSKFEVDTAKILQVHIIKTKKSVIENWMNVLLDSSTHSTHLNWMNS